MMRNVTEVSEDIIDIDGRDDARRQRISEEGGIEYSVAWNDGTPDLISVTEKGAAHFRFMRIVADDAFRKDAAEADPEDFVKKVFGSRDVLKIRSCGFSSGDIGGGNPDTSVVITDERISSLLADGHTVTLTGEQARKTGEAIRKDAFGSMGRFSETEGLIKRYGGDVRCVDPAWRARKDFGKNAVFDDGKASLVYNGFAIPFGREYASMKARFERFPEKFVKTMESRAIGRKVSEASGRTGGDRDRARIRIAGDLVRAIDRAIPDKDRGGR